MSVEGRAAPSTCIRSVYSEMPFLMDENSECQLKSERLHPHVNNMSTMQTLLPCRVNRIQILVLFSYFYIDPGSRICMVVYYKRYLPKYWGATGLWRFLIGKSWCKFALWLFALLGSY